MELTVLFLNCGGCPDALKLHTAEGPVHLLLKFQSSAQIKNIDNIHFNVINYFQATVVPGTLPVSFLT
jgi:hypothetical protein